MIKLAKVVEIKDPLEKGRIQVRVYPEFKELKKDDLPWAYPKMTVYNDVNFIPKIDSFLYLEISEDWVTFTYLDSVDYILNNYRYKEIKEILDEIDEVSSFEYPDPDFKINPNGFIEFFNKTNKETGYVHSSGTYVVFKENGDYYIKNPDLFEIHFSENKIEMKNLKSFTIDGSAETNLSLDIENGKLELTGITDVIFKDSTNVALGGATESAVLYAPLKTILDTLLTHTHPFSYSAGPTPAVGTTEISPALTPLDPTTIESDQVTLT